MHARSFVSLSLAFVVGLFAVLAGCGGGGGSGGSPTGATTTTNNNNNGATVTGSTTLGVVFSQNGSALAFSTQGGIQTVSLHNTPFQISVPDRAFTNIYIRSVNTNTGNITSTPAGDTMARYVEENTSGWYLSAVTGTDTSLNGFSYADTVASNGQRILNIKEFRDRGSVSKTTYGTLYLQFHVPTQPASGNAYETIRLVLN